MKRIVGVRFRHAGKSFYYDPGELELSVGTEVIVRAGEGLEYGKVSIPPMEREESQLPAIIKNIERIATEEDKRTVSENTEKEEEAYKICKVRIAELGLPMKLIQAEYAFDRKKLLFYFTAEGRVDFRDLVRILAAEFRTRIELRQIGVRDETRLLGGIGICGRPLCCSTYLAGFAPVSIKMAKEQNLSLNPSKISGVCGRLMCCLSHEEEAYEYLNRTMPRSGDYATDIEGKTGTIRSVNILKQTVLVIFEDGDTREMKEYSVTDVGITNRRQGPPSPEEVEGILKKLEEAEEEKLKEQLAESVQRFEFNNSSYDTPEAEAEPESPSKESEARGGREKNGKGRRDRKGYQQDKPKKNKGSDKGSKNEGKDKDRRQKNNKKDEAPGRQNRDSDKGGRQKNSREDGGRQKNNREDKALTKPKKVRGDKPERRNSERHSDKKNTPRNKKQTGGRHQGQHGKSQRQEDSGKQKDSVIRNGGYSRGYRTDRRDQ